jgi:hypothetical protein
MHRHRLNFSHQTCQSNSHCARSSCSDKYYMGSPFPTSQFACPNGLVPLQRMARGAPVFLSQAGFYNVDPSVYAPYNMTQQLDDVSRNLLYAMRSVVRYGPVLT